MEGGKKIVGILLFIVLIAIILGYKYFGSGSNDISNLTTIYVATGGGKEDFIADEEINEILKSKYKLNVVYDSWSNGKTVTAPLIREYIGEGNKDIADKLKSGLSYDINSADVTKYDALFTSDQRYYETYKTTADVSKGESPRYRVMGGSMTLNTPIVVYSWKEVVDVLIKDNIVTQKDDGVYYITDMPRLIDYIVNSKKWKDLGLDIGEYKYVNIDSVDPVRSSPGVTYYGLLLSILCNGMVTEESASEKFPALKTIYDTTGFKGITPADLFDNYLRKGYATMPLIVDYEKSMIEFANKQPKDFEALKDEIKILYPDPTIWNSHCYAYFTDNGKKLYDAFDDERIQQIAWEKYGFRVGTVGGKYDVTKLGINIPKTITSTVSGFKTEIYDLIPKYLDTKTENDKREIINELLNGK